VGGEIELLPEVRAEDVIRLTVDCNATWISGSQNTTTQTAVPGTFNTRGMQTVVQGHVGLGETLIIGGLANKWDSASLCHIPLLSELPGVGSWFCFKRE